MDNTPGGAGERSDYRSYLLRLWRENDEEKGWRASLESSRTGERRGFASLDDLFKFLRDQTDQKLITDEQKNSACGREARSNEQIGKSRAVNSRHY